MAHRIRILRNILNTIFIFGALIGMVLYYKGHPAGTTVIIVAMAFKFIETTIRLLKLEDKH